MCYTCSSYLQLTQGYCDSNADVQFGVFMYSVCKCALGTCTLTVVCVYDNYAYICTRDKILKQLIAAKPFLSLIDSCI